MRKGAVASVATSRSFLHEHLAQSGLAQIWRVLYLLLIVCEAALIIELTLALLKVHTHLRLAELPSEAVPDFFIIPVVILLPPRRHRHTIKTRNVNT